MVKKIFGAKEVPIWRVAELADIILIIIVAIAGILMGFLGEITSTSALLFICGLVTLLAFALLFVLRKLEESKKLIASVVSKVEVILLKGHDDFYTKAEEEVTLAKKSIDVTHFYPIPTTKIRAESKYFDTLSRIIKEDKIITRRIASINNMDKYKWVESTIREHQDTDNFHVKYTSLVSDDFPMLNILIFDNKKVFVGIYQEVAMPERAIFIDNETIAIVFSDYYNTIWEKSENLKIGRGTNEEKLNELKKKYENVV